MRDVKKYEVFQLVSSWFRVKEVSMSGKKPFALLIAAILGLFGVSSALVTAGEPFESGTLRLCGTDSVGDTLWSFRAPQRWPSGLAWDGNDLWLADIEVDSLYRLSMEGVVEAVFPMPESARSAAGMIWLGGRLWMVDENTSRLYVLDPATAEPLRSFELPDTTHDPTSWGLAWDGAHLWHSEYAHGRIYELDTTDGSVLSSFAPPDSWIMGLEYDGQYLWGVSTQTGRAYVMSLPSGAVVQSYHWRVPYSLGITLVNGYMWCASGKPPSGTRRVYRVDIEQGALAERSASGSVRRLAGAVPNPFRVRTQISAAHSSPAIVGARVFDAQGRQVRRLCASGGAFTWDGADRAGKRAAAGAYVISVRFADGSIERQPVRLTR
jgi:hypothetical protein